VLQSSSGEAPWIPYAISVPRPSPRTRCEHPGLTKQPARGSPRFSGHGSGSPETPRPFTHDRSRRAQSVWGVCGVLGSSSAGMRGAALRGALLCVLGGARLPLLCLLTCRIPHPQQASLKVSCSRDCFEEIYHEACITRYLRGKPAPKNWMVSSGGGACACACRLCLPATPDAESCLHARLEHRSSPPPAPNSPTRP